MTDHVAGSFSGELSALSDRPSFVDGVAVGDLEALRIDSKGLHEFLIAEATLGEKIMRAMILRRVALLESKAGGPVIVGSSKSTAGAARLGNFLDRNGIPHLFMDTESDVDARAFVERYAAKPEDLPLAICPDGTVLRNPSESELAHFIGMIDEASAEAQTYDVATVGAGPGGLAAAVHAASEGLEWSWSSMRARTAGRPGPAHGSRTTWDFRPASPARTSRAGPTRRRRSSARGC